MSQTPKVTLVQLEALVAARVMGLPVGIPGKYPRFARDIAVAWTIVEKLCGEGYQFDLSQFPGGWRATFDAELTTSSESGEADDCPTAPVAICLAALGTWSITVEVVDSVELNPESLAQGATAGAPPQANEPEIPKYESGEKVYV